MHEYRTFHNFKMPVSKNWEFDKHSKDFIGLFKPA